MSSIDSSAEDHAYFQAIETTFIRLRGAPLLLSPADWLLASDWRQRGVPLELVLGTLERVFEKRAARAARGRIHGLRYCAEAVETAWAERRELLASGSRRSGIEIDVSTRLETLAVALPDALTARREIAQRIREMKGSAEEVEEALNVLDREIVDAAAATLRQQDRDQISTTVEEALSHLEGRISRAERDRLRQHLHRQAVRRRAKLPVLSLFAPEAQEPP